ncbi:DUF4397 domain-containing protein [Marinicrinis sediminis]|uniref:DUF4397 domain-containing protein n=1 Tax=Marinicrinis sediminis TaxID=1652465 RepID=A0ABW5R6Z4_9BACL
MEDWRIMLQKSSMYGILADYYTYTNPEMHIHYYKKYLHCVEMLAAYVKHYGDPYEQNNPSPAAIQPYQQGPYAPNAPNAPGAAQGANLMPPMPAMNMPYGNMPIHPMHGMQMSPHMVNRMEMARIRVLHASPDAPAVDVYANGKKVASGLKYKQVTDYMPVPPGDYQVEVFPAGEKQKPVLSQQVQVSPGNTYTVAAANKLADLKLIAYLDEPFVAPGLSKLRFIHLAPDAPAVDVALKKGNVVFSNISFGGSSAYAPLQPNRYDFEVRAAGTQQSVLDVPQVNLEAKGYTIVAVGLLKGKPALDAILLYG